MSEKSGEEEVEPFEQLWTVLLGKSRSFHVCSSMDVSIDGVDFRAATMSTTDTVLNP